MRRNHLGQLVLDGYLMMSQSEKDDIMEYVFQYYYDRNDMDLDTALDEILGDLVIYEHQEEYERCALLKDIIERFE